MLDLFHSNPFLFMALLAGWSASIANGIVGSYVVVKRIVFISGSIAHAVIGGIGLFVFLEEVTGISLFTPFLGALIFAILAGFFIGWIHLYHKEREDTVIAAFWSFGMAIGIIFLSLTNSSHPEIMSFLFGNILWAGARDIQVLLILDALVIICTAIFHKSFLAICFDEEQAFLQKRPVKTLYFLLLILVAIYVVLLIRIIVVILLIAMLSLPAAIANIFSKKLSSMILLSILLSAFFSSIGTLLSFLLNWPPGSTITLTTTLAYFLFLLGKKQTA